MTNEVRNDAASSTPDESLLGRRGLMKVAAAASVATGLGTILAAKPALADERGHHHNIRHHTLTDRNGLTRTFFVFHDLDADELRLAHRSLEDPVDEYSYIPLEKGSGPYDDLSLLGDGEGRVHVGYLNRADGHIYHHEIFPDEVSRNRRHTVTGHLRRR
jgi:hypothetical protein